MVEELVVAGTAAMVVVYILVIAVRTVRQMSRRPEPKPDWIEEGKWYTVATYGDWTLLERVDLTHHDNTGAFECWRPATRTYYWEIRRGNLTEQVSMGYGRADSEVAAVTWAEVIREESK